MTAFQKTVWEYYGAHGRDLPWRHPEPGGNFEAYKIIVSEIMLQQTQVSRVVPKYHQFLERFPNVGTLARATLGDVLKVWSGLGYNRRAKFLHMAAKSLATMPEPWPAEELIKLPGIGKNTAGAVTVYAYNQPAVFVETNIRTVFIHHFFKDYPQVSDSQILEYVLKTLPLQEEQPGQRIHSALGAMKNPPGVSGYREWYWALMDYGAYLKATVGTYSQVAKAFTKQSSFVGSKRQLRGQVIKLLTEQAIDTTRLVELLPDTRLQQVLAELEAEGFVRRKNQQYSLT
ncbi:MAG: mutY [Candidatus Saccharibacteria bacterium]|nr:mutY [Candidatus Saccharibacteria bacterium]